MYTIGPESSVYTIEPQTPTKKKESFDGGGVYFFLSLDPCAKIITPRIAPLSSRAGSWSGPESCKALDSSSDLITATTITDERCGRIMHVLYGAERVPEEATLRLTIGSFLLTMGASL